MGIAILGGGSVKTVVIAYELRPMDTFGELNRADLGKLRGAKEQLQKEKYTGAPQRPWYLQPE
jgi:hypothetical protein